MVVFVLLSARPLTSELRVKSAMTCVACPCEFPRPVDTALKPVRACATVVSSRYSAWRYPAMWIDESWMMLFEHLGFQPKGVTTLSFSSR